MMKRTVVMAVAGVVVAAGLAGCAATAAESQSLPNGRG